jgi:hypothetical protein
MSGKGDKPRPVNWAKYGANWDAIFGKKHSKPSVKRAKTKTK